MIGFFWCLNLIRAYKNNLFLALSLIMKAWAFFIYMHCSGSLCLILQIFINALKQIPLQGVWFP